MEKLTNRKFQNIYIMAMNLEQGKIGENKEVKDENGALSLVFEPYFKEKTAAAYAAKRLKEKNEEEFKKIETYLRDKAYEFALLDKDTGEALYNIPNEKGVREHGPYDFRMTLENQKLYEKAINEFYDSPIDFEVKTHICKDERLPDGGKNLPYALAPLNGYIFDHKFFEEEFEDGQ